MYVTNDEYPFGRSKQTSMFGSYAYYEYKELPSAICGYIAEKAEAVGIDQADLDKFAVLVFGFYGEDDRTRYKIVRNCVQDWIDEAGLGNVAAINSAQLRRTWELILKGNAQNPDVTVTVSKADLTWPLIAMVCEASKDDRMFDDYDEEIREDVLRAYKKTIEWHTTRYQLVTKVLSDFDDFKASRPRSNIGQTRSEFLSSRWESYVEELGAEHIDEERAELLVKIVLRKILVSNSVIRQIKEGVNLAD